MSFICFNCHLISTHTSTIVQYFNLTFTPLNNINPLNLSHGDSHNSTFSSEFMNSPLAHTPLIRYSVFCQIYTPTPQHRIQADLIVNPKPTLSTFPSSLRFAPPCLVPRVTLVTLETITEAYVRRNASREQNIILRRFLLLPTCNFVRVTYFLSWSLPLFRYLCHMDQLNRDDSSCECGVFPVFEKFSSDIAAYNVCWAKWEQNAVQYFF